MRGATERDEERLLTHSRGFYFSQWRSYTRTQNFKIEYSSKIDYSIDRAGVEGQLLAFLESWLRVVLTADIGFADFLNSQLVFLGGG